MSDIKNRLKEKIDSCYSEYKNKWLVMSPEALIENADEISVVNKVHMLLVGAISDTDAEYLIRFKNPLEVISDTYMTYSENNGCMFYEVCEHLMWKLTDSGSAEVDYDVEPEFMDESDSTGISMQ